MLVSCYRLITVKSFNALLVFLEKPVRVSQEKRLLNTKRGRLASGNRCGRSLEDGAELQGQGHSYRPRRAGTFRVGAIVTWKRVVIFTGRVFVYADTEQVSKRIRACFYTAIP